MSVIRDGEIIHIIVDKAKAHGAPMRQPVSGDPVALTIYAADGTVVARNAAARLADALDAEIDIPGVERKG